MALRLVESEPRPYQFVITPTGRELPAMKAHWARLETLLGAKLIIPPGPSLLDKIKEHQALPNWRMRWCTREVKIEPFIAYVAAQAPAVAYVGIRADEVLGDDPRGGTDWRGIAGVSQDLALVRWGWGLVQVREYLAEHAIAIPTRTDCDLCFFQRLIEWYEFWRDHRDAWMEGEALEAWTGHTLRSAERDSWPASMRGLRERFEAGDVPRDTRNDRVRKTMCSWCAR